MRTYSIIKVEWEDCQMIGGWQHSSTKRNKPAPVVSAGIRLRAKKDCLAITPILSPVDRMVSDVVIIPRKTIKKITVLETFRA